MRAYYKHHKEARKTRNGQHQNTLKNEAILKDPAIQRYFTVIRNRPRNAGFLSDDTRRLAINSARSFLEYLQIPITDHALSNLIEEKRKLSTTDYTLEDKLENYANPQDNTKLQTRRACGTYVLGIFKANRCPLRASSPNHFDSIMKPISEGILKEIYSKLDLRYQDLLAYQAYAGQRITCLATVPLGQIDMQTYAQNGYAIIHILSRQNKTRQEHDSIVPLGLMESILDRCEKLHLKCPFPNYEQLWKDLTKHVLEYYGIRLTSHYLRKRFATIASETPMDVNQWDYLMGSKKSKGHDAKVYNLTFLDKLITAYDTYLVHKLSLEENSSLSTKPVSETKIELQQLKEIIKIQKEQIDKLTEALTKN